MSAHSRGNPIKVRREVIDAFRKTASSKQRPPEGWINARELSERLGFSVNTARRHLRELENVGAIEPRKCRNSNNCISKYYDYEAIEELLGDKEEDGV
jgi:DNA-binding transcriptional ArsR family regulator